MRPQLAQLQATARLSIITDFRAKSAGRVWLRCAAGAHVSHDGLVSRMYRSDRPLHRCHALRVLLSTNTSTGASS